jgi:hypothetical protein
MTTRERWIVYPLLFLAIGLALRSGLILHEMERRQSAEVAVGKPAPDSFQAKGFSAKTAIFDQLVCNSVTVLGTDGKPVIMMGAEAKTRDGVIEMRSADSKRLLLVHPGGAEVVTLPLDKKSSPTLPRDTKSKDVKTREKSKDDEASNPDKADAPTPAPK